MRLIVFGATGMVGKYVIKQALAAGFYVKAFGRNVESLIDADESNENFEAIKGYIFDEESIRNALEGVEAVISVLGGAFDGSDKTRSLGMKNIVEQMQISGIKRIVALGGLGILDAPEGGYVMDDANYPAEYLPVAKEHLQAYLFLKDSNLKWTIIGAPNIEDKDKTGDYSTSENSTPQPNNFKITAGDLAHFMLTEAQQNKYLNHRVGISN